MFIKPPTFVLIGFLFAFPWLFKTKYMGHIDQDRGKSS